MAGLGQSWLPFLVFVGVLLEIARQICIMAYSHLVTRLSLAGAPPTPADLEQNRAVVFGGWAWVLIHCVVGVIVALALWLVGLHLVALLAVAAWCLWRLYEVVVYVVLHARTNPDLRR